MSSGALTSLLIVLFCVGGVVVIGRRQAVTSHRSGLRYWQPWRVWIIAVALALFALLLGFQFAAGSGWLD